jgi:hypothetical protein
MSSSEPLPKRPAKTDSTSSHSNQPLPGKLTKTATEEGVVSLLNPIVVIALAILGGVFFLIGAAIFGLDKGVLAKMSDSTFARGLITYLFAVVTIGTAVVLVVYSLTTAGGGEDQRFNRGKDVLSLLLGVFGTIVGFYFGESREPKKAEQPPTQQSQLDLRSLILASPEGQVLGAPAQASRAAAPYRFGITTRETNNNQLEHAETVSAGWLIIKDCGIGGER